MDVATYYPDSGDLYEDPGNRVVSGAIEYPFGSYATYGPSFQVDINATQLIIRTDSNADFAEATFNGFIMTVVDGPSIITPWQTRPVVLTPSR